MSAESRTLGKAGAGIAPLLVALVLAGTLAAAPARAQQSAVVEETSGSLVSAAAGGVIGVVAGGYGNLAIVVVKARFGRYPHSFRDAFGWESIPILTGGGTGVVLGYMSSDLLMPWIIGGASGFGAGMGLGYLYGLTVWGNRESRWANSAVGAAVGMTIGSTIAIIHSLTDDGSAGPGAGETTAPAIRVPLLEIRF